jgi:hypothetical protein
MSTEDFFFFFFLLNCLSNKQVGVVKLLLEYGADALSTRYEDGETIAQMARKEKQGVQREWEWSG